MTVTPDLSRSSPIEPPDSPADIPAASPGDSENALLTIKDLTVSFGKGGTFQPVKGISLSLRKGEVAGLVGESGSGKSITAFTLMGLLPFGARVTGGEMLFKGRDLGAMGPRERRSLCGSSMGMIFQEPLTALNPVLSIGEQVAEIFRYKKGMGKKEAKTYAIGMLSRAGLPNPKGAYDSYPHRFSGGMRQRVVIAMALALNPDLVIADEPTTALDPTIANQIVSLLKTMTSERGVGTLFITHNLRLLTGLATRIYVMYAGVILEETSGDWLERPVHPYARGLVNALPPNPSERSFKALIPIPGSSPGPSDNLPGCPFAPRCPESFSPCDKSLPPLTDVPGGGRVRCFRMGGI
jgi:oligopeptide/dipeptide ABC transporter ATP-binding protein